MRDVAGNQTALAAASRGAIACHRVHPDADARRERGVFALREDPGNGSGQNISGAGSRHTGVAALA